jgi:hypothetical protein
MRMPSPPCSLSAGARDLQAALETAGIGIEVDDAKRELQVFRMPMDADPPHGDDVEVIKLPDPIEQPVRERDRLRHRIETMERGKRYYLDLGKPIRKVRLPGFQAECQEGEGDESDSTEPASAGSHSMVPPAGEEAAEVKPPDAAVSVRWLRVPPESIRKDGITTIGSCQPHVLTDALGQVVRRAVDWRRGRPRRGEATPEQLEDRLRRALERLMRLAYTQALGQGRRYKDALIGERVLRPKLPCSGRAVIVPAGLDHDGIELDLDQVGLPHAVAFAVFREAGVKTTEDLERHCGQEPWVWVKRDPVLHRWGLLRMRTRLVPGNVIRLPAGVLGPLGGDYDGDCVAVFNTVPGFDDDQGQQGIPSRMGWDDVWCKPMFMAGKQYVYGLHLLQEDADRFARLNSELAACGAPPWPRGEKDSAKSALEQWATSASQHDSPSGKWWAVVEKHALLALSRNPGMDLGLPEATDLATLGPVIAGAAKKELFERLKDGQELYEAYLGRSLSAFGQDGTNCHLDTIKRVMVPSKAATPHFGNVPGRFINAAKNLESTFVRRVHALSERASQKALSVKAGGSPLDFGEFKDLVLDPLLSPEPGCGGINAEEVARLLDPDKASEIGAACKQIKESLVAVQDPWSEWLSRPAGLAQILARTGGGFSMPLDDPRVARFLA